MDKHSSNTSWTALVGTTMGPGSWLEIDQSRINAFADVTDDHQVIHIDPTAEATQALGGTIAHGFLGLSLLSYLSKELLDPHFDGNVVLNYGLNKVRFITPIPASSKISLTITIREAQEKPQGTLITYDSQVNIYQQPKPAFIAEQLILILE